MTATVTITFLKACVPKMHLMVLVKLQLISLSGIITGTLQCHCGALVSLVWETTAGAH